MSQCQGTYYDGQSSQPHDAILHKAEDADTFTLTLITSGDALIFRPSEVDIESPLGSGSPRTVRLPKGAKFYTENSAQLDTLNTHRKADWRNPHLWASALESHKQAILLSVVLLAAFLFVSYQYGIPAIADSVSKKIPHSVLVNMSQNTLDVMDKYAGFKPTELPEDRQAELTLLFKKLVAEIGDPNFDYQLVFRQFPPNALALPSGTIVFSDQLIEDLDSDLSILAVMAHEVAHVEERHGVRQVIRQASIALLVSLLLNDVSSVPAVLSALPELLLSSNYSRTFESEADQFSAEYLCAEYGTPEAMVDALEILQSYSSGEEIESAELISSHPLLEKRIEAIQHLRCDH